MMLKSFLFKRPSWFRHEGYWRLAQVFRLAPSIFLFSCGVICLGVGVYIPDGIYILRLSGALIAAAIGFLVLVHLFLRLIVWIVDGFKAGGA